MQLTNLNKDKKNRRKPSVDLTTMVYGKVPPQAKDIEEAVLGAVMLEKGAFDVISEILKAECFYVNAHQHIFKSFQSLAQKNLPIDILTAVEELKSKGELDVVGGPYALTKLTNNVVSTANLETHARIIYQKYIQREIIRISGEAINEAYEDSTDVFDMLDTYSNHLNGLSISKTTAPYRPFSDVAHKALNQVIETRNNEQELTGVPSGISLLDAATQGWQPTNLIIIAARPSIGKSAVAGNLALGAATSKIKPTPVGIFSLEMPSEQWMKRMLSSESEISLFDLTRGRVTDDELKKLMHIGYEKHASLPIFFDDTSSLDILQFKSKARTMVAKEKVGLIILDYLQLVNGNRGFGENREQEIAKVSRELKQLAKELHVPIIALSQLSRAGDTKAPKLSDLRESGAIEQDADDVIFLIPVDVKEGDKDLNKDMDLIMQITKHRNGTVGPVTVKFVKSIQKIMSPGQFDDYMRRQGNTSTVSSKSTEQPSPAVTPNKFIEIGSKMSGGNFDDGFDEAAPF